MTQCFVGMPSIRRQRRLPYCSNSPWLFWFDMFYLLNSDTWCFSIWFSDFKCLQWHLISFSICLVISFRRSFKTLKTFVKFSSCSHILASKQHFCSSNFSSIFLVIIKTLFKKDKLCHSRKWIMVDVRGCYIIMH